MWRGRPWRHGMRRADPWRLVTWCRREWPADLWRRREWRNRAAALLASLVLLGLVPADLPRTMVAYAPLRHPFRGTELFLDQNTAAARWQSTHSAEWLRRITRHPQARWVTAPTDLEPVPSLAQQAQQRGELLVLVVYHIPNRDCAGPGVGAGGDDEYRQFIEQLVAALHPAPTAVILEPDAVAAECFDHDRAQLLEWAVWRLTRAGHYVYLDAGHPGWHSTGEMADRLLESGIADAEGFSVNVANRQTTEDSYRWARELSEQLGDRQFVIDTSRNGHGPPPSHEWCNPRWEALGEPPTTRVDRPGLAALLWIKPPGESDGACGGADGNRFSPQLARRLIHNGHGK